jgi:drug/metabolite transporter (DMT)-like permease
VPPPSQTRAYVALVLIAVLWGSYPATTKLALEDFPPFLAAAIRCSIASAFLVLMLVRAHAGAFPALTPAAVRAVVILGLAGIYTSTQITYVAIYYTTAANAVILQAATPAMVALGARLYLGERLRRAQWAGVAASALGVVLVITKGRLALLQPEEIHAGDLITLVTLTGWTAYTVYGKRVLATVSPELATTGAYVFGTLLIVPTAVVAAPYFPAPRLTSPTAWAVVLYQALVGAIAHVWWYRAVHVVGPSRSAIFMNVQPVVGIVIAATLVGERIGAWQIAGALCVLAGVALTTRDLAAPARGAGEAGEVRA